MSSLESGTALPFEFVDYASSLQDALAEDLLDVDRPNPSDLSQCIIWCETRAQIHSIKLSLSRKAKALSIPQLLLPSIVTLEDWVWQQDSPSQNLISETSKQLVLVEAIRESPNLFKTNNAWPLAKELVNLFNECTLAQVPLNEGEHALRELLQTSYGYPTTDISNISRESEIVYRLWQAYREQIQARDLVDPLDHYCQWLIKNKSIPQDFTHCYVVGKHRLNAAEVIFFNSLNQSCKVSIYSAKISSKSQVTNHHPHLRYSENLATEDTTSNSRELALDIIYNQYSHTYDRIQQFKKTLPSNVFSQWLSLYSCSSIEDHVSAVCLQAKKWLIEGNTSIGIIINDRLFARRVRAVLEEHGIQPNDLGGWTLSTTSAATSIEVLLDAIEHNFKKDSLLDLLSSPFLPNNNDPNSLFLLQTYTLRKYLKKHRNTLSDNLDSMTALALQCFELQDTDSPELIGVLGTIKSASNTLQTYKISGEYELFKICDVLITSLKDLGIYNVLENDAAGKQLIEVLDTHALSTRNSTIKINWKEWRQWLRDLFEHNYFIPEQTDMRINLCGFEHTDNLRFDAVIIAGVEQNRLSNSSKQTFFNEKVCHELYLPTSNETNAINFVRFRQLIQQSKKVLLSAETEIHGEPQELSSWVKLINLFSQQTYSCNINNNEIHEIVCAYKQHKQAKQDFDIAKTIQPQPAAPAEMIPRRLSATQYQSLINCPFQYFAKYVLAIREYETADEFEASDYGTLVHQCLHEFHFHEKNKTSCGFNESNIAELNNQLKDISTSIFMHAAFPNTIKQGWLQRWLHNIPNYIQWSIEHAKDWRTLRGESEIQIQLNDNFHMYGKIDRIDTNNQHYAVIDYKTGSTKPAKKNVLNGEIVQLPFYALLDEKITQAEYVTLGTQGEVKSTASLNEQEIELLKSEHKPRLENLFGSLLKGGSLIAQGDENTCRVCDYQGLCRKQHWS